jgi:hypothetical protein
MTAVEIPTELKQDLKFRDFMPPSTTIQSGVRTLQQRQFQA